MNPESEPESEPESDPLHTMLADIREEAWSMLPLWRQLAVRLVWFRCPFPPMWNLAPVRDSSDLPRPFDIIGGFWFFSIAADIAAAAPRHVLLALHGCLFVHTSRYVCRSRRVKLENGNGGVPALPSW